MNERSSMGAKDENKLAESMGFTCVPDAWRGGNWCKFVFGDWQVWSIASWIRGNKEFTWQVARIDKFGFRDHYTRSHLKPGEYGIDQPGFLELKDALDYAKLKN